MRKDEPRDYVEYDNVERIDIKDVSGDPAYDDIENGIAAVVWMRSGTATFDYINWTFEINHC
jgi:hypothetical protein